MKLGRELVLFVVLVAIGMFLGRTQTQAKSKGSIDPISSSVQAIVNPPARLLTGLANSLEDFSNGLFGASALKRRNRDLEAQVQVSNLYAAELSRLQRELDSLRKVSGFSPSPGRTKIPATIIGLFPKEYRITISAGSSQGVRPGLAVVSGEGLVGVVQTVSRSTAQVTLVYSPTIRIGAVAERNPPPAGLLRGDSTERLVLEFFDAQVSAATGDLVVTSGFSDKIPGGIPIGRIAQIEKDEGFGTSKGLVFPNVRIGTVREVIVLR
ncbi:MAG TPA: rod shape-determining protein MreC [Fimbriimonadaceae bacterium]|nr:rod shape-determining protein MreC [Fimbriimonadaceae bacterium]